MATYGKTRINAAGLSMFELEPCCWGYIPWYVSTILLIILGVEACAEAIVTPIHNNSPFAIFTTLH